ncbi:hypothetical protein HZC30_00270 [Candidatus Woesearchaeota archaeon]|nr:hypothetical protein [Candidatus Woesearchaeota archaeon]
MKTGVFLCGLLLVILLLITSCTTAINSKSEVSSDPSLLLGFWKQEKQYNWNNETKNWEPGLVLENGTITDTLPEPSYREFIKGIPKYIPVESCPVDPTEKGIEYFTMMPGGCFRYYGGIRLEFIPMQDALGSGYTDWVLKGESQEILELETTVLDETGAVFDQSKAIFTRTTKEEAEKFGWISPENIPQNTKLS